MFKNYDDETLVMLTLAGETKAYETLVKRYQNAVIGSAFTAINNRFFAEDAAQDAFVTAWMKLDSLGDGAKFLPWVKRIARNCALNLITRYKTALNIDDYMGLCDGNNVNPEEICILNEENEDLKHTIDNLPEKTRLVIKYHYFEDLSVTQIAERMGISEGTVKWQLHDGRKRLRKELCAMNENLNDNLVQKVMKKVEELKLWQLKNNKTGFEKVYKDTLKAVEELPESQVKYHAMADVLARGWWWIKGEKNNDLLEKIKETALFGKNEEVMEYILGEEAREIYDSTNRRNFIKDKQIPYLEESGFSAALADAYIRLGLLYYGAGSNDEGNEYLDKAYELLEENSLNRAYIPVAKKQKEIFEAEYEGKKIDNYEYGINAVANEVRKVGGNYRFWTLKTCGGGYLYANILEDAALCDGYFMLPELKVGQKYENEDGSTLSFISENETVITPCGTFENCQLWETSIKAPEHRWGYTGCISKNYYKEGIGLIKQEFFGSYKKKVMLLSSYSVSPSNEILPMKEGNAWEYIRENLSGSLDGKCTVNVSYADNEKVIVSELCNIKRNFYDENSWQDMIEYLSTRYYVQVDYHTQTLNEKIPYYIEKAKALAKAPWQKAYTKHLSSALMRIVKGNKDLTPDSDTENVRNEFDQHLIEKTGNDIKLHWCSGFVGWYNMNGNVPEQPTVFNRLFELLQQNTKCIWSDNWLSNESKLIETWFDDEERIVTKIESCDGVTVTTKAGTFENCLKLTINTNAEDEIWCDYTFGEMHYYFAKGIGIVRFQKEYDGGIATYDLVEYEGVDESTYMPICDGIYRKYEAFGLTDGYVAGHEYTICTKENGKTYMYNDNLGERKKHASVTTYNLIPDELLEDELWDNGDWEGARFRNSINNFKVLMHLVLRSSPNYGKQERAAAWGKTRLRYLEASFDNGEIPPALYGVYSEILFRTACPMFAVRVEETEEAFKLLDKALEYRKKWDAIPDGTMLEVGNDYVFGGIKIKKGDKKLYLPDGTTEYFEDSDILCRSKKFMYYAMTTKSGWEWFNLIRDDERFKERIKIAKQIAES